MRPRTGPSVGQALRGYAAALINHLGAFVTGGFLSAFATLATNAFAVDLPQWLHLAVFLVGGILVAGFRAWTDQYREAVRSQIEADGLQGLLDAKPVGPKLTMQFDPGDPFCVSNEGGNEMFRVRVTNDGDLRATDVRVVLEEISPPIGKLLHQRFPVMKSEVTVFDVSPSGKRAGVYIDVLAQRQLASGFIQTVRLKGADWLPTGTTGLRLVLCLEAQVGAPSLELVFAADDRMRFRHTAAGASTS